MKIGLDFDGVIANCGKLKSDVAKMIYGVDIPLEKFKKEIVVGGGFLTSQQYAELQYKIYSTEEYGFLIEPVIGAVENISKLIALGHTIKVITSREDSGAKIAKEWSVKQGLDLDFINIGQKVSKSKACVGLDIFVDDDLDKLAQLVDVVPNRFLFSWDYNLHIDEGNIAKRIGSWSELCKEITNSAKTLN